MKIKNYFYRISVLFFLLNVVCFSQTFIEVPQPREETKANATFWTYSKWFFSGLALSSLGGRLYFGNNANDALSNYNKNLTPSSRDDVIRNVNLANTSLVIGVVSAGIAAISWLVDGTLSQKTQIPELIGDKNFATNYYSDTTGPEITIIEPPVTRGVINVSTKDIMHVMGVAKDISGVKEVQVNGELANLDDKNYFNTDIELKPEDNKLIVKAIDNKNNSTIETFYIMNMPKKDDNIISPGKYYAFIIGIDKYKGTWPNLKNAVNDAKSIANELKTEYGFSDIISLYNEDATKNNIISKFDDLSTKITKDDNLLIFYSGHGAIKFKTGYWVPVDATSQSASDIIFDTMIKTFINGINAQHILLVVDACFGGEIFRGQTPVPPFKKSDRYLKEVYSKPSRYALTSGNLEPVTDGGIDNHSIFVHYLLKYLMDKEHKNFTAGKLFSDIVDPVSNNSHQIPQYKLLQNAGDEGGEFIFFRK